MDLKLDFEWPVASSYTLRKADPPDEPNFSSLRLDGVRIDRIVANGGPVQKKNPLSVGDLYLKFSQLKPDAKSCHDFALKWGLLKGKSEEGNYEDIYFWKQRIGEMKWWIRWITAFTNDPESLPHPMKGMRQRGVAAAKVVAYAEPYDRKDPSKGMKMVMRPASLFDGLLLQASYAAVAGSKITTCAGCGEPFSGRRAGALYCSNTCQKSYNNSLRIRGREALAREEAQKAQKKKAARRA